MSTYNEGDVVVVTSKPSLGGNTQAFVALVLGEVADVVSECDDGVTEVTGRNKGFRQYIDTRCLSPFEGEDDTGGEETPEPAKRQWASLADVPEDVNVRGADGSGPWYPQDTTAYDKHAPFTEILEVASV